MTAREDLSGVPDGGPLRRLGSGLEVLRRVKHEAVHVENLSRSALQRLTNKVQGSKFLESWPLPRVLGQTTMIVQEEGWVLEPGIRRQVRRHLDEPVGIVNGEVVSTICVVSDGRYVHAYPDRD